jgi:cytochrome c oxidase subunit II
MRRVLRLVLLSFILTGCEGVQSVLAPRGPAADALADFSWLLFGGGAVIFLITMVFLAAGLIWPDRVKRVPGIWLIAGGGLAFPAIVLLGLTIYTTYVGGWVDLAGGQERSRPPVRVNVVGQMWWWEVVYPGEQGQGTVVTANEVHIPVGQRVEISVTTRDVIHSLWIPALHGKMDLIPGRTNTLVVQMDRPGVVRGQCAEFCGLQHALMAFWVIAHEPADFERWLQSQRQPARAAETADLMHGQQAFLNAGCGSCHQIRGLAAGPYAAVGQLGPDLTHVGSRRSIGAVALPNGVGPLAAWIADTQDIKQGARMPSFHHLDGETLTAIARYLESLE